MPPLTKTLCLQCGLCCNGTIFSDVQAEPGDESPLFAGRARVAQPCPAFNPGDCKCALYRQRPGRCRLFECRQLLGVQAGEIPVDQALRDIQRARKLAAKLDRQLTALGFDDARKPLKRRFQQCQRAAEQGKLDAAHFAALGAAQLTMQQLSLRLAEDFYG